MKTMSDGSALSGTGTAACRGAERAGREAWRWGVAEMKPFSVVYDGMMMAIVVNK